jgi:hypothetical protein
VEKILLFALTYRATGCYFIISKRSTMKPILFFLASLLLWTSTSAQSFPDTLSVDHQMISGTNLFLIPPPGFEQTAQFKGFQNPADPTSMIMVMEIPGPFSEVSQGFSEDMLRSRGMNLTAKSDIQIAGFSGLLVELNQTANGMEFAKHILVFGDESSTLMVNGVFLKDSIILGQDIGRSIQSIYVDHQIIADPREALGYTVDEAVGGLQFHSVMGNGMLFNRDLKTPTESEDEATLIIVQSFANVEVGNQELFFLDRFDQLEGGFHLLEGEEISRVKIDQLAGYQLRACNDDGEELYLVMLFDEQIGYYLLMGTYLKGTKKARTDLEAIVRTFRRKK